MRFLFAFLVPHPNEKKKLVMVDIQRVVYLTPKYIIRYRLLQNLPMCIIYHYFFGLSFFNIKQTIFRYRCLHNQLHTLFHHLFTFYKTTDYSDSDVSISGSSVVITKYERAKKNMKSV